MQLVRNLPAVDLDLPRVLRMGVVDGPERGLVLRHIISH